MTSQVQSARNAGGRAMRQRTARSSNGEGSREDEGGEDIGEEDSEEDGDDEFDPLYTDRRRGRASSTTCGRGCIFLLAIFLTLLILAGVQLYLWFNPSPLSCEVTSARAQKFKIDVTDFFQPRVSAAAQVVLSVKNSNFLRSMLLENCRVFAYEGEAVDGTLRSLRLADAQQNSLVVSPLSTTQVTVTLNGLGSSLPQPEQQRLVMKFLSEKALLLTLVATATSRIPLKGSKVMKLASNVSRVIDMKRLYKEPFFQRDLPAPTPPADADQVHDVPL